MKRSRTGTISQRGWKHVKTTRGRGKTKIDVLPDDVLLWVFDFCGMGEHSYNWWHGLVHVCRRWRQLILVSPRRLNLQLLCTCKALVRKDLGLWPIIPIAICDSSRSMTFREQDNILAALEHRDRVRDITLNLQTRQPLVGKVVMMMQKPFPALSCLRLSFINSSIFHPHEVILPDGFLGGNASNLQELRLTEIPFPALPTLLLSANHLIDLHLCSGMSISIPPEAMVSSLAVTTRLEHLCLDFNSPREPPDQVPATPPTRVILPSLTRFQYRGDSPYLEDFVSRIDCPRLKAIIASYFDALVTILPIHFIEDPPLQLFQFIQFIDRTESFKLAPFRHARLDLSRISINLDSSQAGPHASHLSLEFPFRRLLQTQSMRQLLIQVSAMLTNVCHLTILYGERLRDQDIAEWVGLFRILPAVETLHVGGELAMNIDPVFDRLTKEIVAEVLPVLRFLYIDAPATRPVRQYLATRKLFGFPVALVKTRGQVRMLEAARSETNDLHYT